MLIVWGGLMVRGGRRGVVMLVLARVAMPHLLHGGSLMARATLQLHGHRRRHHAAAEQRQPDGQQHGNEFSDGTGHARSLAKLGASVKRNITFAKLLTSEEAAHSQQVLLVLHGAQ